MEHVLELKNISHSYHNTEGETPALKELSFFLKKGEFISIVGPSGCGKSTLLSLIAGLLIPESGTILINGKQLKESTTNIGYMLQRDHLFEWRTIYNNVILGLEIQLCSPPARAEKHISCMNNMDLESFANARPSELSGGMRQRAALTVLSCWNQIFFY